MTHHGMDQHWSAGRGEGRGDHGSEHIVLGFSQKARQGKKNNSGSFGLQEHSLDVWFLVPGPGVI